MLAFAVSMTKQRADSRRLFMIDSLAWFLEARCYSTTVNVTVRGVPTVPVAFAPV